MFAGIVPVRKSPSTITIIPVANGWVVQIPEEIQQPDFQKVMRSVQNAIHNDLPVSPEEETTDPDPAKELEISRDQSQHIFANIDEVLAFLKFKIPSDKGARL